MKTFLIYFSLVVAASAHEASTGWQYGWDCCSITDCFQEEDANVQEQYDGFHIVSTDEIIAYNDKRVRQSKDQFFHRCTRFGDESAKRSICLYVPPRGV